MDIVFDMNAILNNLFGQSKYPFFSLSLISKRHILYIVFCGLFLLMQIQIIPVYAENLDKINGGLDRSNNLISKQSKEFIKMLINKNEIMDQEERQYWLEILPVMTHHHKSRFLTRLAIEDKDFVKWETHYANRLKILNEKHQKEWLELRQNKVEKKGDKVIGYWYLYGTGILKSKLENKIEEAKKAFKKEIELHPNTFMDAWYRLGLLYQLEGNHQQAKLEYLKQIEKDPQHNNAWHFLGEIYEFNDKNYQQARKAYLQQTLVTPKHPLSWENLGSNILAYGKTGKDYKEPSFYYAKHLEIVPDSLLALANDFELALVEGDLKRFTKRYKALAQVIAEDDQLNAILPFYQWLSNPDTDWNRVIIAIKKLKPTIKFSWNFKTSLPIFHRLNKKNNQIAQLFVQFFEGKIKLESLEKQLKF